MAQICRKMCGSSHTNCFGLHPASMISKNTQQSRFLTACGRLEVLPSIFDKRLSSSTMWNLYSYPTTVLNEIMWHFRYTLNSDPSYIFSGGQESRLSKLQDLRHWDCMQSAFTTGTRLRCDRCATSVQLPLDARRSHGSCIVVAWQL